MMLHQDNLLRAYPKTPANVTVRIDETLNAIHLQAAKRPPKRYATRLSFATILFMLLLLLAAMGVAAGVHFGVFDFMEQLFGQTELLPQATDWVQSELAAKETEHTLITLSQAVYDGGNLRLVYSVQVKDATAPITVEELDDPSSAFRQALAQDGVSPWGCDWLYVGGEEYSMTGGSTGTTIPGGENGEALCYMDIYLASAGIVPEGDFSVGLPIIHLASGKRETLDFTVKAETNEITPLVKQVSGATVTVESAFVSPIRIYVNLHIQIDDGVSAADAELLLADWQDAVLVDGAGNELAKMSEFQVTAQLEGESADFSYTFLPTDAREVYLAPTVIDKNDNWFLDMTQAIQIK